MKINNPRSEAEALSVSRIALLTGWQDGVITEASDDASRRGNAMQKWTVVVTDAQGRERTFFDYLTDTEQGALRLRHAMVAVGGDALAKYEAGEDVRPEDVAGAKVKVKLKAERRGGFNRSVIEDYRPFNSSSVASYLRTAGKALVLLGSVSLMALTTACASGVDPFNPYPRGQSFYAPPLAYQHPAYVPPQNYAYRQAPVASTPSPSWNHDLGVGAVGAGLGVAGVMAARGGTAAALGEGAVTAGRAVGAARAGAAAVGAAEAAAVAAEVEEGSIIIEIIEGLLLL